MDVANNFHLKRNNVDMDVTPESVAVMRDRASPTLDGTTWTMVSSVDPYTVGQDFMVVDGKLSKTA